MSNTTREKRVKVDESNWCAFCAKNAPAGMYACERCRERARMIVKHDDEMTSNTQQASNDNER